MISRKKIKELALSKGFKLKKQENGKMDLNPYVYEFAEAMYLSCVRDDNRKENKLF